MFAAPGVCLNIIKERQESNGVGTVTNPKMFLDQDYELLHQYYLVRNRRYIDDMFPPDNSSIGENLLKDLDVATVEWIRPTVFQQKLFSGMKITQLYKKMWKEKSHSYWLKREHPQKF